MKFNLRVLLKHLEAVKMSPWSENYVRQMIKELREEIKECESIIKQYPKDTVGIAGQLATIAKIKELLDIK